MNQNFKGNQGGFTLIELIVVIVILGILAATALPKFANLSGDARVASINAVKGSISSVSAMTHGRALLTPAATTVTMENTVLSIVNAYPDANDGDDLFAAAGLSTADYTLTKATDKITVSVTGAPTPANCSVSYTNAAANGVPQIAVVTTGC